MVVRYSAKALLNIFPSGDHSELFTLMYHFFITILNTIFNKKKEMENVILGQGTIIYIDENLSIDTPIDQVPIPGNFEQVICLTDNSFDGSTSPISTSNKCTGLWATSLAGEKSGTFGGNGDAVIIDGADDRYNMDKVAALWASGAVVWWLQYNENGTSVRYALGYVSSYNDTSPNLDRQSFSFTVTLSGEIGVANPTT